MHVQVSDSGTRGGVSEQKAAQMAAANKPASAVSLRTSQPQPKAGPLRPLEDRLASFTRRGQLLTAATR